MNVVRELQIPGRSGRTTLIAVLTLLCLAVSVNSFDAGDFSNNAEIIGGSGLNPINGSSSTDLDTDSTVEWIYGNTTSGNYIYWNTGSDTAIADGTNEFFKVQTAPIVNVTGTPETDLIFYTPMDNEEAEMYDFSMYGNNGTIWGAITQGVSGKVFNAYDCNGWDADNRINITDMKGLVEPADEGTIVFWVNPDFAEDTGNNQAAVSFRVDSSNNIELSYNHVQNKWQLKHRAGATNSLVESAYSQYPSSTWSQMGITWNKTANEFKAYRNGQQEGSTQTMAGTWAGSLAEAYICYGNSNSFEGQLDDVRIYNRTLTQPELQAIYDLNASVSGAGAPPATDYVILEYPPDGADEMVPVIFNYTPVGGPYSLAQLILNTSTTYGFPEPTDDGVGNYTNYKPGTGTDNEFLVPGSGGSWDDYRVNHPYVTYGCFSPGEYRMYYSGHDGSGSIDIGFANGTAWDTFTKYGSNPVFTQGSAGTWDDVSVTMPVFICDPFGDGTHYMLYRGNDGSKQRIGLATSTDGISWTRYPANNCSGTSGNGCIIDTGSGWESLKIANGIAFANATGGFHILYGGIDVSGPFGWDVGYANSTDLINWQKYSSNPVIPAAGGTEWNRDSVMAVGTLVYDGGEWHALSAGKTQLGVGESNIGYWSAPNPWGPWTGDPLNPVLITSRAWEGLENENPQAILVDGIYDIYYDCYFGGSIGGLNISVGDEWGEYVTNSTPIVVGSENSIEFNFSGLSIPQTFAWDIEMTLSAGGTFTNGTTRDVTVNPTLYGYLDQIYDSMAYETDTVTFNLTIADIDPTINIYNATLYYDGTEYGYDYYTTSGSNATYTIDLVLPLLSANQTVKSFYWSVYLEEYDGTNLTINDTGSQTLIYAYYPGTPTKNGSNFIEGQDLTVTNTLTDVLGLAEFSMRLYVNETGYVMAQTDDTFSRTFNTTEVTSGLNYTLAFNTSLNVTYAGTSRIMNSTTDTVTVHKIVITNCSAGTESTTETLHFYVRDEDTDALIIADVDLSITPWKASDLARTYSWGFNGSNNYNLCIYPPWASYTVDMTSQFEATGYSPRTHYLSEAEISNETEAINLYLKDNETTDLITMQVLDSLGLPEEDVYIHIARYYIATDTYSTVAIVKTDFDGKAYSYLTKNTVWYRFTLVQDGEILEQYSPTIVTEDSLTFRLTQQVTSEYFEYYDSIAFNCTWPSNTTTCTVTDTSGLMASSTLQVWRWTSLGYIDVCETSDTGSTVTLVCPMGSLDGHIFYYRLKATFQDSDTVLEAGFRNHMGTTAVYGTMGIFLALIVLLVLSFMGVTVSWEIGLVAAAGSTLLSMIGGFVLIAEASVFSAFILAGIGIYKYKRG